MIPWKEIEYDMVVGKMTFLEASRKYTVKEDTIRKRALRYKWPTITAVIRRAKELAPRHDGEIDKQAEDWNTRGEQHREKMFKLGSEAIDKMKPTKPRNWKEADVVDKIVRRAAGLENAEVVNQTLIQLNEAMEAGEQPIEATVLSPESLRETNDSPHADVGEHAHA